MVREKKLRALAVTGETRSPGFPDVPTVKESGLTDYVQYSWNALFVRSDVSPAIRTRLGDVIRTVMTSRETIDNLHRPRGTEARPLTSDQVQKLQLEEIDRFRKIAKSIDFNGR